MLNSPKYSIVVPVYNRPEEVRELLTSLTEQSVRDFEVIIVEDGSKVPCDEVVNQFRDQLAIEYVIKPNSGPGPSRNIGFARAKGEYFVVFDSDCIVPPHYFMAVNKVLQQENFDAWGGPDRAHDDFTVVQQAMGYTMSSVLTTGGIRGGNKRMGWFQPRSFNMGISRKVFEETGGFKFDRLAEDIELSVRIKKLGFKIELIVDAYVFHKRRASLEQFYHQVSGFGAGRVLVGRAHPGEIKITHWFPTFFVLGLLALPFVAILKPLLAQIGLITYGIYITAIFIDSFSTTKNFSVAVLSLPAAIVQLAGYGVGFLGQWLKTYIK